MSNGMKFLFILNSVLLLCLGVAKGQGTPEAAVTPYPTPACSTNIVGRVTDATTKAGIEGAVIIAEPGPFTATTDVRGDYVFLDLGEGEYTIRATAVGYIPSEAKTVTVECGFFTTADFELEPIVTPGTPTVGPTPIGVCTEPNVIEVSGDKVKLIRKQSSEITVTVTCEDGSPLEEEEVTAIVRGVGKRVVKVAPSAVTDASGTAVFTVVAKNRVGRARVIFKVGSLKKRVKIFVRRM